MSTAWLWVQILFMETILGIDTWYTFPEIHFWCAPLLVYMASIVTSHFPYMHVSAEVGMPDSNEDLLSNHSDQICLRKCELGCPLWLWNPEEMSPEVRNRDISGPINGNVSTKNLKEQVSIQVGCVPPACWLYLGVLGGLHPWGIWADLLPRCEQTDRCKNITCLKLQFRVVTRMHSSRICTTCFSGCLRGVCWGVCGRHPPGETPPMSRHTPQGRHLPSRHPLGRYPPGRYPPGQTPLAPLHAGIHPPPMWTEGMRRIWKHYLPTTIVAGGKKKF